MIGAEALAADLQGPPMQGLGSAEVTPEPGDQAQFMDRPGHVGVVRTIELLAGLGLGFRF
jgi:hypothetical protein